MEWCARNVHILRGMGERLRLLLAGKLTASPRPHWSSIELFLSSLMKSLPSLFQCRFLISLSWKRDSMTSWKLENCVMATKAAIKVSTKSIIFTSVAHPHRSFWLANKFSFNCSHKIQACQPVILTQKVGYELTQLMKKSVSCCGCLLLTINTQVPVETI